MRQDLRTRFFDKIMPEPNSGCWLWIAAVNKQTGYGVIGLGGRRDGIISTHRLSWEIHRGPIPDGLCVLHRCDVRCCVNPSHLFLGTKKDNAEDMVSKGRDQYAHRNTCVQGHPFTHRNSNQRLCRTCQRERAARAKARRLAA